MAFSTAYSYRGRSIFDLKSLFEALRFLIINAILAFIFLFLTLEEIDWAIFSSRAKLKDEVVDNSSWNIKNLLSLLKF